jgi:lipopolysaccharide transport system permease protein
MLAWQDIRQAYRRSALGPFWLTLGMAVQIGTIGLVFGIIFQAKVEDYLPFLAVSVIIWGLIASTMNDGCQAFISSEQMIKQLNLSYDTYAIRVVAKNLLTSAHNLAIIPLVFVVFSRIPSWSTLLFLPGLLLLIMNLYWVVLLFGIISSRFRDFPPIVNSLTTVAFYLTPVMWYPELLGNNNLAHFLLGLNPLYHFLQIVRLPLLGQFPTVENWIISFAVACIGWFVTLIVYQRSKKMIAYWV